MTRNVEKIFGDFHLRHHEALISVWITGIQLKKAFRQVFRDRLPSEAQFNLLRILKYYPPPLTQQDIGNLMFVDRSNITGLVDALQKSGLVKRNAVEEDRRRYHITLTEKGRKLVDEMDEVYLSKIGQLMSCLSSEETETLVTTMKKLRSCLPKVAGE